MHIESRDKHDSPVQIIGIDCATQPGKVGLALGRWEQGRTTVSEACNGGNTDDELVDRVVKWATDGNQPVLFALDAPLGWPDPMREGLSTHKAGMPFYFDGVGEDHEDAARNAMFRRATDFEIATVHKKTPLDVGADRIARTAYWTLTLVGKLQSRLGKDIPLAWSTRLGTDYSAIEVYPAVTMLFHELHVQGYKQSDGENKRKKCLDKLGCKLEGRVTVAANCSDIEKQADVLDAVMCVVAAADFLDGLAPGPAAGVQNDKAVSEGWIWAAMKKDTPAR